MSYCSVNKLPIITPISRLFEIIELLGYEKVKDMLCTENQIGSYVWLGNDDEISFVGVELEVYKYEEYISVEIRTRFGRSYWDLKKQNKTISLIRSLFGGSFETDEGKNRYMDFSDEPPSRLSSALYLARWIFNNEMIKPIIYLDSRQLTGDLAKDKPIGLSWIDELNPKVLSHNMLIPYIIGCWEAYLRRSYIAIVKYSNSISEKAFKNNKPNHMLLLSAIRKENDLVTLLADNLSFQRPSVAAENFKQLNSDIDLTAWLSKPYHRRKKTLFDSLTELIELRNSLVHTGKINLILTERMVRASIDDMAVAADRIYDGFGIVFDFKPDKLY